MDNIQLPGPKTKTNNAREDKKDGWGRKTKTLILRCFMFKLYMLSILLLFFSFTVFCQPDDLVSLADSAGVPTKFYGFKFGMTKTDVKVLLMKLNAKIIASDKEEIKAKIKYNLLNTTFQFSFPKSGKLSLIICSFANTSKSQFDKVSGLIEKDIGTSIGDKVEKVNESFGYNMPEITMERNWGSIHWTWEPTEEVKKLTGMQKKVNLLPVVHAELYWNQLEGKTGLEFTFQMGALQNYPSSEFFDPDLKAQPPPE